MQSWLSKEENLDHIRSIRDSFDKDTMGLYIFLGAGLSFGVDRGRATFDWHGYDDKYRFPSWAQLMQRMERTLLKNPVIEPHEQSLKEFFKAEGPLDCAQLFRNYMNGALYYKFLQDQFGSRLGDHDHLTQSHQALVRLPLKEVFTTNYDELIELTYQTKGMPVRVSASGHEFLENSVAIGNHVVKLHGTIQHPESIVLTRSDYTKSRHDRAEMFGYLLNRFKLSSFVFVGFSLTDPNFNILYDEARYIRRDQQPVSYVVQSRPDPIRDAYLQSMGINNIVLNWWEDLPEFLQLINPTINLNEYVEKHSEAT